jgi:hypothetical protein
MRSYSLRNGDAVAGVQLNNNTAYTKISRKTGGCEATKLWLERCYNKHTTNEANDETERRIRRIFGTKNIRENEEKNRLEMFVRMGRDDVCTWNWRWPAC